MSLQSITYLLFALAVWLLALPLSRPRHRQVLLLAASYIFYATWGLDCLAILIASSLINYAAGEFLRRKPTVSRLWLGVAPNLALLATFKYLPSMARGGILHHLFMPVGISFWSFEALSYLFDVYSEDEDANPSLLEFCLYIAFWPTVLAGPVCRVGEMLAELRREHGTPQWDDIATGVQRIVLGLFMKLVLAEILLQGVAKDGGVAYGFDQISGGWGGLDAWLLALGFGFQLFFDFAGYTHIAIGSARLFGIRLPENFDRPYMAPTPAAFWNRWHMSLSFWIRDYVFLPLAMVWPRKWWLMLTLVLSMVLFGLWHGATAAFVVWGAYQGGLLVAHRQIQALRQRFKVRIWPPLDAAVSWAFTFFPVSLGWLFFRSRDLHQALELWSAVFHPARYTHMVMRPNCYIVTALIILGYFATEHARPVLARISSGKHAEAVVRALSPAWYAAAILLIIAYSSQESIFVYFRF